ncbi:hypothetical protein SAMN04489867_0858 [Pedococcus dokdonensis]|uniref:Peptidoglycan binding domain-containing protein n=1 Tax=Pedococcus dokdonensis TaxID=443156 RepID=A0A1H0N871_9MICO|nr:hypothetical protein [Pedococcus dokdonensis]SDO88675.1 hypothetical protein SAMN04489867_0858 [Pedococcus dokdonensis]
MPLSTIAAGSASVHVSKLGQNIALAKEIQTRLALLGCLDPPADGQFGSASRLTLARYAKHRGFGFKDAVTPQIAKGLLTDKADAVLPLKLGNDFASRMVRYLHAKGFFVARLPGFLNIVYVEGTDKSGRHNADKANVFNDRRTVFHFNAKGVPVLDLNALCTTEPGRFFTINPVNPDGAARIAFGQYKAWTVGFHHPELTAPRKHEALVQSATIKVFRDKNKDGIRPGDKQFNAGSGSGINQHSGHNQSPADIGKMSAGCLVGQNDAEHKKFMKIVKTDPRFAANHGYRFITTVIAGDDLDKVVP